jgi:hypothetical protein
VGWGQGQDVERRDGRKVMGGDGEVGTGWRMGENRGKGIESVGEILNSLMIYFSRKLWTCMVLLDALFDQFVRSFDRAHVFANLMRYDSSTSQQGF